MAGNEVRVTVTRNLVPSLRSMVDQFALSEPILDTTAVGQTFPETDVYVYTVAPEKMGVFGRHALEVGILQLEALGATISIAK